MSDRDSKIDAKAAELSKAKMQGWDIGAAKSFFAEIGPSSSDEAYKDAHGKFARCNGWPVTTVRGALISLAHVSEPAGGPAFDRPGALD